MGPKDATASESQPHLQVSWHVTEWADMVSQELSEGHLFRLLHPNGRIPEMGHKSVLTQSSIAMKFAGYFSFMVRYWSRITMSHGHNTIKQR